MSRTIHIGAAGNEMTKVWLAEDERSIRELLVDTLNGLGHDVLESVDFGETYQIT